MPYFLTKLLSIFISLRLTVICLLLLSINVLVGTFYQKTYGLFAAQEDFYYSWFSPVYGYIPPLPGGLTLLWLLFINLLLSMMIQFQYGLRKIGIVFVHFGILLMLAGGWITHLYGQEGFLSLQEGEASNLSSDYREWELSIWTQQQGVREVSAYDQDAFKEGVTVDFPDVQVRVTPRISYVNSRAFLPKAGVEVDSPPLNASGIIRLEEKDPENEPEKNMPGLLVDVEWNGETREVLLFGGDQGPLHLEGENGGIYLHLRRTRYPLPVLVRLIDFKKEVYPNSTTPKSFSSSINVLAHEFEREVLIEMNRPFRYLGFTFFQASYAAPEGQREISTFAVTRNYGRLIPYVATGITVLGLIIHFIVEVIRRRPTTQKGAA